MGAKLSFCFEMWDRELCRNGKVGSIKCFCIGESERGMGFIEKDGRFMEFCEYWLVCSMEFEQKEGRLD